MCIHLILFSIELCLRVIKLIDSDSNFIEASYRKEKKNNGIN